MQVKNEDGVHIEPVEWSFLVREDGFTVNAFAVNEQIGKVAVLRRHDTKMASDTRGLCRIEFYSAIDMPRMFLEKTVTIQDTLVESIAWIGKSTLTCVCLNGSIIALSAFSTLQQRFQISATPFWCACSLTRNEIVAGTDSGNIYVIKQLEAEDGAESESGQIVVSKQFNIGSDQRPMAMAASSKLLRVAVGCLDKVFVLDISQAGSKANIIQLQREHKRATVAFSLLFLGKHLFIGDSRGSVSVYNAKTCALIKNLPTHQAAVLALTTDHEQVFASGADYRIQVLKALSEKTDFVTTGQRIVHDNDVRAMAVVNGWLLSGGAEHDFNISKPHCNYHPIKTVDWSCSSGLRWQLLPSLYMLNVVKRQLNSLDQVVPSKVVGISSKNFAFEHSSMSPSGQYIGASTRKALKVYQLKDTEPTTASKMIQINCDGVVTAMAAGNEALYYSVGDFNIMRLTYGATTPELIFKGEAKSNIRKLLLSPNGKRLLAFTQRYDALIFDLSDTELSEDNNNVRVYSITNPTVDVRWFNDEAIIGVSSKCRYSLYLMMVQDGKLKEIDYNKIYSHVYEYDFVVAISDVVENRIVVINNRNKYSILQFDNELRQFTTFESVPTPASASELKALGDNDPGKPSRLNRFVANSRLAPQWAQLPQEEAASTTTTTGMRTRARERQLSNGKVAARSKTAVVVAAATSSSTSTSSPKEGGSSSSLFGQQRVFVCGTQPAAAPTQIPFAIKRFNRN